MRTRGPVLAVWPLAAACLLHAAAPAAQTPPDRFSRALVAFADAARGTAGDEGPRLLVTLDEASRALAALDTAGARRAVIPQFIHDTLRGAAGASAKSPPAIYADGFERLARGELRAAIDALREAAKEDPLLADFGLTSAVAVRGIAAQRAGRITEAIARFEEAVDFNPDSSEVRRALALAWCANKRPDRCVEQLQGAVELNSRNERARLALVDAFLTLGNRPQAERALRETLMIFPQSGQAHWRLTTLTPGERAAHARE